MPGCQHDGMNKSLLSVPMPGVTLWPIRPEWFRRHAGGALAALSIVLACWLAWSAWPGRQGADDPVVDVRTFAHWHGDGRDWLLKAEPEQGQLTVYDATDGRPLRRLPAAGVKEIVLEGDWLFVIGDAKPRLRLLRLPQMTWRHDDRAGVPSPRQ
jgi:hypothetical protein